MTDRVQEKEQAKESGNNSNGLDLVSLSQQKDTTEKSVGYATIEKDGTLHLNLRSSGPGPVGEAHLIYKPADKSYASILKHIGDIKPGEVKNVRPFETEKK